MSGLALDVACGLLIFLGVVLSIYLILGIIWMARNHKRLVEDGVDPWSRFYFLIYVLWPLAWLCLAISEIED